MPALDQALRTVSTSVLAGIAGAGDLVLTLDQSLQYETEKVLTEAVNQAQSQ